MSTDSSQADLAAFDQLLNSDEIAVRNQVAEFGNIVVRPVANHAWKSETIPLEVIKGLADLGLAGGSRTSLDAQRLTRVADGLIALELARADGSVRDLAAVHDLAITTIHSLGTPDQHDRWLPEMKRFDKLGAFALTEPEHGSDARNIDTKVELDGDHYILNGTKRWITNGTTAGIVIVWAKDHEGRVGAFVVEPPTPGYSAEPIRDKISLRSVPHAVIRMDSVRISSANRLPHASGFGAIRDILASSRVLVSWEAIGHAIAALEAALQYSVKREQFGRPIASFQLVQAKLAETAIDITASQLMCWRASKADQAGTLTDALAAATKAHATRTARQAVANAREILGGNGLLLENDIARHQADMEAVFTYEGTYDINRLVVGRFLTGLNAIS